MTSLVSAVSLLDTLISELENSLAATAVTAVESTTAAVVVKKGHILKTKKTTRRDLFLPKPWMSL